MFPLRTRDLFVNFRWLLVLILLLMMAYSWEKLAHPSIGYLLIIALFATNLFFSFLRPKIFDDLVFDYIIFIVDIAFVSLAMFMVQETGSDFYLLYFLTILMSSAVRDIRGSLPVAVVISLIYSLIAMRGRAGGTLLDTRVLMRIPFFFLVAIFSGFLVHHAKKRVEDREKELQDKLRRQDRLALLGQMAAWVAHEIRNPLTTIKGRAQLIRSESEEREKTRRHADFIDKASDQIDLIIRDTLDFSRERETRLQPVDLNSLMAEVVDSFREEVSGQGVEVKLDLDANLPEVRGNREELRRVILNLLNNSSEAMKGKGEIAVRTCVEEGRATIELRDNGPGIPKESASKIFEPFYSSKPKGVGLGLTIVRKIIDDCEGTIEVQSEVGKGTLFTIRLPIDRQ